MDDEAVASEVFRIGISIAFVVVVVVVFGSIWIAGVLVGIVVIIALAAVAGAVGQYAGSSPTAVTSASFSFLYLRTILRELPGALRRMVKPSLIIIGLWYVFSLFGFASVALTRLERTGGDIDSALSGFAPWMSDANRVAAVLFVIIALWQLRPVLSSVVTLLAGLDGKTETTMALGAREPTRGELDKILASLTEIQSKKSDLKAPNDWMVLDVFIPNHYVIGRTAYLSSALIDSEHITVGMVHALGHVQHGDGVILLALRKLITPLPYYYGIDRRAMPPGVVSGGRMAGGGGYEHMTRAPDIELADRMKAVEYAEEFTKEYGGVGLVVYGLHWASFWRERVFLADSFTQRCGYGPELIKYLQEFEVFDVAQPFLARGRPYTKERLDRLEE